MLDMEFVISICIKSRSRRDRAIHDEPSLRLRRQRRCLVGGDDDMARVIDVVQLTGVYWATNDGEEDTEMVCYRRKLLTPRIRKIRN